MIRHLRDNFLRLLNETVITVAGQEVTVRGRHERKRAAIVTALDRFLPSSGTITISGKRIRAYGRIAEFEQQIRNVLNIDLRL